MDAIAVILLVILAAIFGSKRRINNRKNF